MSTAADDFARAISEGRLTPALLKTLGLDVLTPSTPTLPALMDSKVGGGGGAPTGAAGGGLSGTYPNPGVVTVAAGSTGPLSATDASTTNARTPTAHASTHAPGAADDLTTALSTATLPVALGAAALGSGTGFSRSGHVHPTTGLMLTANNLSDLASASTARSNLGFPSYTPFTTLPSDGFFFPYRSTDTTGQEFMASTTSGASAMGSAGQGNIMPMYWSRSLSVYLGINITGAVATALVRIGVWAADGTNNAPGTLLADLGTIDASTGGRKYVATSFAVTGGTRYWVGAICQTAVPTCSTYTRPTAWVLPTVGTVYDACSVRVTGVTGALASTPTINAWDTVPWMIQSKIA